MKGFVVSPRISTGGRRCRKDGAQRSPVVRMVTSRTDADEVKFFGQSRTTKANGLIESIIDQMEQTFASLTGGDTGVPMYMLGNYAPVATEIQPETCEIVEGEIPEALEGAYMKLQANPAIEPKYGYDPLDGDGMLHVVRFKDGQASYANRFIMTERLKEELEAGNELMVRARDLDGPRMLLMTLTKKLMRAAGISKADGIQQVGYGTANTALSFINGQVLALHEGDYPYGLRLLCSGITETIGVVPELAEGLPAFTAHPKVDVSTGGTITFGYQVMGKPHCVVGFLDADAKMTKSIELNSVKNPNFMHDIAATENFVIPIETAFVFDMGKLFSGEALITLDNNLPMRFGVLPKSATGESAIRWIEIPGGGWLSHIANAWESAKDEITIIGFRLHNVKLHSLTGGTADNRTTLALWTLKPETGEGHWKPLLPDGYRGDWPMINKHFTSFQNEFVWFGEERAIGELYEPGVTAYHVCAVGKVDIALAAEDRDKGVVAKIEFGENTYGGEFSFVPRYDDKNLCDGEDDGYLIGYVHNHEQNVSYFVAYDAKTMDSTPVCKIKIPQRIPYGFHGMHINEERFQKQLVGA